MASSAPLAALVAAVSLTAAGWSVPAFGHCALGSSDWREYRSAHFWVDTDLSDFKAVLLVKTLERIQGLELRALDRAGAEVTGRVRVLAVSDTRLFEEIAGGRTIGGYFTSSSFGEPTIVLSAHGAQANPGIIAHELAHHLSWFLFPAQPPWFGEGLADFTQSVIGESVAKDVPADSHAEDGTVREPTRIGRMPRALLDQLAQATPVPTSELLAWDGQEDRIVPDRYHLWSWLLFHWLWTNRPTSFADYRNRLALAEDPRTAWRASFPEFDPSHPEALRRLDASLERYRYAVMPLANTAFLARLDEVLALYRRSARSVYWYEDGGADESFTETPLSTADLHLLLLDARRSWPDERTAARLRDAELDEALREDTSQPMANVWRAQLEHRSPLEALRTSVSRRAWDWRAWLLLGDALDPSLNPGAREAAYRKAVALNPDSARAQASLTWALLRSGRSSEALASGTRALKLAPWEPAPANVLANVLARLGRCPEARELAERAVRLFDAPEEGETEAFRRRLHDVEAACGPRPTPNG